MNAVQARKGTPDGKLWLRGRKDRVRARNGVQAVVEAVREDSREAFQRVLALQAAHVGCPESGSAGQQ